MNVTLIGTSLMGYPMAERLFAAHHRLTVFDRTKEKAGGLKSLGASVVSSAGEATAASECIILTLSDARAIKEVLVSRAGDLSDRTVIQMGTITPRESIGLSRRIKKEGGEYLEAPVLGSIPQVKAGKLFIMVSGSREQFERWSGFLVCFGPDPFLIGKVGSATALKLALNQRIASIRAGFCLSLGCVQRMGLDVEMFMKILRRSTLFAPTFDKKLD